VSRRRISHLVSLHSAAGFLKRAWFKSLFVYLILIAALEAGVVIATRAVAARVLNADSGMDMQSLLDARLAIVLLTAVILFMVLRTLGATALWSLAVRRVSDGSVKLSTRLFSSYLHWPYLRLLGRDRLRLLENLRTAERSVSQDITMPLLLLTSETFVAAAIVLVLLVLAPVATLLLILWFSIVFGLFVRLLSRKSHQLAKQRWHAFRQLQEFNRWTFQQFRNVRLMGQESQLTERYKFLSACSADISAKLFLLASLPRHVGEFALLGSVLILFSWFSIQGHNSHLIMQEVAILGVASMRLLPAAQRAVNLVHVLEQKLPDLEEMLEDLSEPQFPLPEATIRSGHPTLFKEILSLENAFLTYENGLAAVPRGTNLFVNRGEWVHVSGPSGVGKTTLVSALLGLLPLREGTVAIDGWPVDMLSNLRGGAVAVVPQDASIIVGTILENISFPLEAKLGDIDAARELLNAIGVERSPEEPIGENGASLSGGQMQKIAIVRALLLKPELLVLDEATSQIDSGSEQKIFSLIRKHIPQATVVVIAHRLSSVNSFDRLWAHNEGKWENIALGVRALAPSTAQEK
jgi:ABC-type multidrug transport system fused ATPase/permease subunit